MVLFPSSHYILSKFVYDNKNVIQINMINILIYVRIIDEIMFSYAILQIKSQVENHKLKIFNYFQQVTNFQNPIEKSLDEFIICPALYFYFRKCTIRIFQKCKI